MDTKPDVTDHFENVGNHGIQHRGSRSTQGVRASRMEEALAQENPQPLRKSFLKLYACIFVAYLCCATNGFDANTFGNYLQIYWWRSANSILGGLSAMPGFVDYFGINSGNQGLVAALVCPSILF